MTKHSFKLNKNDKKRKNNYQVYSLLKNKKCPDSSHLSFKRNRGKIGRNNYLKLSLESMGRHKLNRLRSKKIPGNKIDPLIKSILFRSADNFRIKSNPKEENGSFSEEIPKPTKRRNRLNKLLKMMKIKTSQKGQSNFLKLRRSKNRNHKTFMLNTSNGDKQNKDPIKIVLCEDLITKSQDKSYKTIDKLFHEPFLESYSSTSYDLSTPEGF